MLVTAGVWGFVVLMGLVTVILLLLGLIADISPAERQAANTRLVLGVGAVTALVAAGAVVSLKLGARFESLNDPPKRTPIWADPAVPGASVAVIRYLSDVGTQLRLPAAPAEAALNVLAGRIYSIVGPADGAGRTGEQAATQALSAFGQPADVARQIRQGLQSTRRTVIGCATGVAALMGGLVAGSVIAAIVVFSPYAVVRETLIGFFGQDQLGHNAASPLDLFMVAVAANFVAFYAARRAVRVSAAASRHRASEIGPWWAALVGAALAVAALLLIPLTASWPQAVAQLGTPVAFALGSVTCIGRPWPMVSRLLPS
jgi:hypothetical protein